MKYKVWDSTSYGHMEPLVPFTKLHESEKLSEVVDYVDEETSDRVLFVTIEDGSILFDNRDTIFESPDGEVIYKRTPLSNKRTKNNL